MVLTGGSGSDRIRILRYKTLENNLKSLNYFQTEAGRSSGAQSVTVNATGCEFAPFAEIKYLFNFIFSFLRSAALGNARR